MAMLVPTLAFLAASVSANAGTPVPSAIREGTGSTVTVSARIIRAARVGPGLGPPAPRMVPRRTTVSAADGRAVAALVYDFE